MAATRIEAGQDVSVTVEEPLIEQPRGFRAPGTARMIGGSLIGALCAYLFQVVGGRTLGTEAFAPIAILWTVFFIAATVSLIPLEQFVTREVGRGRRVLVADRQVVLSVTFGTGLLLAAFVYFTRDGLFGGEWVFALQAFLLTIFFGFMQLGKGVLAGHRRFATYGSVLLLEGLLRLAAAVAFLAISPTAVSLGWAMVCAPLGIFLISPWRLDRETVAGVVPTPARGFLSSYAAGASASQLLLAGAPLGVAALGGGEALRSIMFQTFTLYRAPLTLIYNLQGRVLSLLVRGGDGDAIKRLARRLLGIGVVLVALAGLVGLAVGPKVVEVLYGAEFRPAMLVAALAAAGVIAAAVTQVLSQALVAAGSTGELAGAWIGGLLVGLATMVVLPGTPDFRVAAGFVAGEIAALAIAAWRTVRRG
jgi:O-antigen/teichoic acid export membrane protein